MPQTNAGKSSSDRALARLRLDARVLPLRENPSATAVPRGGWLRVIRQALGMPRSDLAARLGITSSTVERIEASEQRETIQLDTLRRAASALDCELVYALVPRQPLEQAVEQRRQQLVRALNAKVHTHMALEGQDTAGVAMDTWRRDRAAGSITDRQLWKTRK